MGATSARHSNIETSGGEQVAAKAPELTWLETPPSPGLTYAGLLEGDGGGGSAQGVDRRHVDFVGGGGEDLGETDVAAVLVVRILLHLQRALVVSVDVSTGWTSAPDPNPHVYLCRGAGMKNIHIPRSQIPHVEDGGLRSEPGKAGTSAVGS